MLSAPTHQCANNSLPKRGHQLRDLYKDTLKIRSKAIKTHQSFLDISSEIFQGNIVGNLEGFAERARFSLRGKGLRYMLQLNLIDVKE